MNRLKKFTAGCAAVMGGVASLFAVEQVSPGSGDDAAAITAAIAAASGEGGDGVVQLAPGTYTLASTVTIDQPVTVKGHFAACTTITASGTGYSLFKLTNAGAVLERVTLTGATATTGAGVTVTAGTVQDSIIANNKATASGANAGAGVWLSGANCFLRRCRIENNTATSGSGYGGGIYATGASVIEACSVTGNTAQYGGGIYCEQGSSVTVAQCSLWANVATYGTSGGADIYDWLAGSVRYLNCVMSAERVGKGVMTGCIVSSDRRAEALSGKGVSLASETALEGRDLTGTDFKVSAPSVGCTEYDTDGLKVNWTGVAGSGLGTTVDATFAYENKTEGMTVETVLYDPAGTRVGGSDTGADFSFTVTDVIGGYTLVTAVSMGGKTWNMFQTPFTGGPSEIHVSLTGAAVLPYATEETALTDIQTAVDFAIPGATVIVHDGTYPLDATLRIERPVTVRSANGRDKTTLKPAPEKGLRLVYINDAAATLDGFTLTGGKTQDKLTGNPHGGGAYIDKAGGTVDNCLFEKCGAGYERTHGVAVKLSAPNAVVRRTIIRQNEGGTGTSGSWGSVYMTNGGVVDNCLIYGNKAAFGAGVYIEQNGARGVILNSTIMDNTGGSGNDVYVYKSGSAITNSIVGSLTYDGGDNISAKLLRTAKFKDKTSGDYTPLADEATVIDQGVAYEGMPTTDVYGNRRVSGAGVDIGAVEFKTDELQVELAVDKASELYAAGQTFTLTPTVSGASGAVTLDWTITADHGRVTALSAKTANEPLVFSPTGPGAFTVTVAATDAAQSTEPVVYEKMFVAGAAEVFVDEKGGNAFPYATAAAGAHDFDDAWDLVTTGSVVHVAAGLYRPSKELALKGPIQVLGAGRDATTLRLKDGANDRVAELNEPAALIRGCTLAGGRLGMPSGRNGCGVLFGVRGGTVEDCRITDNRLDGYAQNGGGVAFVKDSMGVVRRTIIDGNEAKIGNEDGYGGGIYTPGGGVIENCLIVSNTANWGGAVYLEGDAAFYMTNCTLVANRATKNQGPEVYYIGKVSPKRFVNSILGAPDETSVYSSRQSSTNGHEQVFLGCRAGTCYSVNGGVDLFYTLSAASGNVTNDPQFVDAAAGDYHLKRKSTLRKAGLVTPDMKGLTDLDGRSRLSGGVVDIGCYQTLNGGLTIIVR